MRLLLLTIFLMVMVSSFAQSPQISVSRNTISTAVANGGTTTQTFTITNTGNRDLVWNLKTKGVPVDFTKPSYADWNQASMQDRMTPNVWITRQNNQGLFNIFSQAGYTSTAPAGTEWAFGYSEDLSEVDYQSWNAAVNGDPQSMIDNVISMHAIEDDRYFDITFHTFSGSNSGGGFSYTRVEYDLKWTSADFISGTLIPGQSKTITLTFDASDLAAGLQGGFVVLESNDPATPEKSVSLNLTVADGTGLAEIDVVTSKDLGDGYANFASEKIITINNLGTGMLNITSITSDNSAFVQQNTAFSIAPGNGHDLRIMFMPNTPGFYSGNLTLTTNDSDESSVVIALTANAFGAPVVAVTPSPITGNLSSGTTSLLPFTITNNGLSELAFEIDFALGQSIPVSFTKTNFVDPLLPENQDRVSPDVLITRADDRGLFNAAVETSFNGSTSPMNTQWAPMPTANATPGSYTNWRNAMDSDPRGMINQVTSMYLPLEDRYFDIVLRQWTCCENGGSFTYERTEVYNWLTSTSSSGTISSGGTSTFDLQFNTKGLPAGVYNGTVIIKSNDPASPVKNVPVTLSVSGTPDARLHESTVDFGNTAIGLTSRTKIRVLNDGAVPLNITNVSYTDTEFTSYEVNGTIQPFSHGIIEIAFTPTAVEAYAGTITIATNDPENPTLSIPYSAAGVSPGEINVVATGLDASVTTGEVVTKTITIENSGAGDLHWTAEMLNTNPVVTFTKEDYADYKQEVNQDRIAPGVWITRKDNRGLFNIAKEDTYTSEISPVGTEWQYGSTLTADLTSYESWEDAIDSDPLETINQTYSLHTANEYYDIIVRKWTSNDQGGGFSYDRQKAAGWIKLSSYSGTVAPGSSEEITLTYDPSDYTTSLKIARLAIKSDDPNEATIELPIQLNIFGLPSITTSTATVDFNSVGLGFNRTIPVEITNNGTEILNISSISSSNPAFSVDRTSAMVGVNETLVVNITFTPGAIQAYTGELQITSDAANESGLSLSLSGAGIQVPNMTVTPAEIIHRTTSQTVFNGTISIKNTGAAPLDWASGRASAFPLSEILDNLNSGYTSLMSLIPSKYNFSYDGGSASINDGGNDMYDGGNILNTDLSNSIPYSNNVIASGVDHFGLGTSYFTRHLDGLYVMVADLNNVSSFSITGNNGADGMGSADGTVLSSTLHGIQYTGYLKRVYGTSDPSINQLIIMEHDASVAHTFDTYTDNSLQEVTNLNSVKRIYYLLYASGSGGFIDNATTQTIMDQFLSVISGGNGFLASWVTLDAYNGTVAPGATQTVNYTLDLTSYPDANYVTTIPVTSNDPDNGLFRIPVEINIGSVVIVNPMPDVLVNEGFGSKIVEFNDVFIDGNSDALTYAVGSNLDIVSGTVSGTTLTLNETGTGTSIVSIRAEDANGNIAYEDFNFRVNDIPNVATTINDIVVTHGFGSTTLEASTVFVDSDEQDELTLTVTSSNPTVVTATITNGTIKIMEGVVGTSTITLTANDGVGGVASETFVVTVDKATATLTASNTTTTYDGTAKAISIATTPADLMIEIVYTQSGNAVAAPTNAGIYDVIATVTDANFTGSYTGTLTISKAEQTITFEALAGVMNSHAPFTLSATSSAGLPVSFSKVSGPITINGNTVTLTGEVGEATIAATQAGNENYNAATAVNRTFAITQDPILSVDNPLTAHVQAYPVPAKEYLNISTGSYTMARVTLTDSFGRTVYSEQLNRSEHTIHTSTMTQGIYILQVVTEKGLVSRRVEVMK